MHGPIILTLLLSALIIPIMGKSLPSWMINEEELLPSFLNTSITTKPIPSMIATPPFDTDGNFILKPDSLCNRTDDTKEAKCYRRSFRRNRRRAYRKARAVVRIRRNNRAHCTGFLVGNKGHILTNWHCAQNARVASQLSIEVMAEGRTCATNCKARLACEGRIINSKPVTFIVTGGSLQRDYTLLRLTKTDRETFRKVGYLKLRRSGARRRERIYIPQHPFGHGKRIAIAINPRGRPARVVSTRAPNFNGCGIRQVAYTADTFGGSSGSPVISFRDHKVVAVHHCGGCSKYANTAVNSRVVAKALRRYLPRSAF